MEIKKTGIYKNTQKVVLIKINLQEIRQSIFLSKKRLSQLSGVALSYISEMENGKYINPSVEVICKLCSALKCTPNELINYKEEE